MTATTLVEVLNQAELLSSKGDISGAIYVYRQWLSEPQSEPHLKHVALFNLGSLLRPDGQLEEAIAVYHEALQLRPDFYQAAVNLGLAYEAKGDQFKALSTWHAALQPIEGEVLLLNHSGRLCENLREYDKAEKLLKRSLMVDPDQPDVIQHYLHIRQKKCQWPILESVAGISVETLQNNCGPLGVLALTDDPALQLKVITEWVNRKIPRDLPRLAPVEGYSHPKLRIGYMSCDFRWHAVSILTAELFELHDRENFKVYAIDFSIDDVDLMRQRVLAAMDLHLPIHDLSDEDAAKLIHHHEIDILIDLTGLTANARPGILAFKPAPVQIAYLGYVGTCGIGEVDYILADRFVFPQELAQFFVEKPLYLPGVYQSNDTQRQIGIAPSRESCLLPSDCFVYCSFNGSYKITPEVFSVWMRILERVDKSVLWLIADNEYAKINLKNEAKIRGINPERIIFAEKVAPSDYLARYQIADLMLDTSPYNAGTTASDALWAGLPVLTCPGRSFASRMAGSLLHSVGLSELVASDWVTYEQIAIRLAGSLDKLADYKMLLSSANKQLTLFDSKVFIRGYESILKSLYSIDGSGNFILTGQQNKFTILPNKLVCQTKPKILVNRLEALGDVILITPIIKKLFIDRNGFCEIYVRTYYTDVFKNNPYVTKTFSCFETGPHSSYDITINLDHAYENNPKTHVTDAYGLYAFGSMDFDKTIEIFTDENDAAVAHELKSKFPKGYIVVHMRNTRDHSRNIPSTFWQALIANINQISSLPILQIGGAADLTITGNQYLFDYRDKFTLQQLKEIISNAMCFIGADSAPMHIAASTNTDIIGLFTTAKAEYRKPYRASGRFAAIAANIECYGCREIQPLDGNMVCFRGDLDCVNRFDPDKIADVLCGFLTRNDTMLEN